MSKPTRVIVIGIAAAFAGAVAIFRMIRARRALPPHHDHPAGKWLKQRRNVKKAERVAMER
jgi:hypothetical protein